MINAWCCANSSFNDEPFVKISGLDGIYEIAASAGMPPGLSLIQNGPNTATINETATTPGNYQFSISAKNKRTGLSNVGKVNFNVLGFTNNSLLGVIQIGANFQQQLNVQGAVGSLSYAIDYLNSPAWMNLNTVTGLLYGTPLCPNHGQHSQFAVSVTDSGTGGTCSINFDLTVGSAPVFTATPVTALPAVVNQSYGQNLGTTGGTGPFVFSWTGVGTMPPGLSVVGGAIQGTPTLAGNYTFTVQAVDKFNCVGASSVTVNVGNNGNNAQTATWPGCSSFTIAKNSYVNYPGGPYALISQAQLDQAAQTDATNGLAGTCPGIHGFSVTIDNNPAHACGSGNTTSVHVNAPGLTVWTNGGNFGQDYSFNPGDTNLCSWIGGHTGGNPGGVFKFWQPGAQNTDPPLFQVQFPPPS